MLLMFTEFIATLPIEDLCFGYGINWEKAIGKSRTRQSFPSETYTGFQYPRPDS